MWKSKLKKRGFIVIFIVFLLAIPIVLTTPTQLSVVFYKGHTEDIAAFLPVKHGGKFDIIWTHSIHLTDVVERYQVANDDEIEQYEIIYEHFGIGMPSNALEGEEFVMEDGKYHIKNLHNVFPNIKVRNGKTVSNHRFRWIDGVEELHKVYFNEYFEPGAWFNVKVEKLTLLEVWKEVRILD